jgi:hypothetical protein
MSGTARKAALAPHSTFPPECKFCFGEGRLRGMKSGSRREG